MSRKKAEGHADTTRRDFLRTAGFLGALGVGAYALDGLWREAQGVPAVGANTQKFSEARRIAGVRVATDFVTDGSTGTDADPYPGSAIQAAVDDLPELETGVGGVVYIPMGKWSLTAALVIDKWVSLIGAGPRSTELILASGTNTRMIEYILATDTGQLMRLAHFQLSGSKSRNPSGTEAIHTALGTSPAKDILFDDLWIDSYRGDGIFVQATHNWAARHLAIERCDGAGIRGSSIGAGYIFSSLFFNNFIGIEIQASGHPCHISDNKVEKNTQHGIQLGPSSSSFQHIYHNAIVDNSFGNLGASDGIHMENTHSSYVCYNQIESTDQRRAISIDGSTSRNNRIIGNDVRVFHTAAIAGNGVNNAGNYVKDNNGYNPQGTAVISVGASPFTYTAGATSETIYITGGIVSDISRDSAQLLTASPATVQLEPHESVVVTYSVAPTMNKDRK